VLVAQILRDLGKLPILDVVRGRTTEMLEGSVDEAATIASTARRLLDRLMHALEVGVLLRDATSQGLAAADLLARARVARGYRREDDPALLHRVDALIVDEE
jgi:hypothetical protein